MQLRVNRARNSHKKEVSATFEEENKQTNKKLNKHHINKEKIQETSKLRKQTKTLTNKQTNDEKNTQTIRQTQQTNKCNKHFDTTVTLDCFFNKNIKLTNTSIK